MREGSHWITWGRRANDADWFPTGEIRHMELPSAVYLRLAAKHWVKAAVSPSAPENLVTFHEFELRAAQGAPSMAAAKVRPPNQVPVFPLSNIPTEVRLVQEVRSCTKCAVFGSDTPYGPFMHVQAAVGAEVTAAGAVPATITAFKPPEPAALHGCRKAPIMLVGINPNLPGHFIFPRATAREDALNGSFRVFTEFRSDQDYATYYRKAPEGALSIASRANLEALVGGAGAGAVVAAADGRLILKDVGDGVSERAPAQRTARLLAIPSDAIQPNAFSWNLDENLVLLRHIFKEGETIASHVDSSVVGKTVDVTRQRLDSYYDNATELLKAIGKDLECETLQLGEDMSLHDAVACASPGWANWQLPQEEIRSNCIDKSRWLHQQIEQSNPAVLVITSREAFNLFVSGADGSFVPSVDQLPTQGGGKDGLFYRVAYEGLIWTHRAMGVQAQTRIVLAPHLSYDDNFRPHSYLTKADWETFSKMDVDGVAWLKLHGICDKEGVHLRDRITQVYGTDDYMVELPDPANGADPIWTILREKYTGLAQFLFARWIAPFEMIGSAVAGEVRRLDIRNGQDGHLQRSRGACSFCDNDFWKIGAGCAFEAQPAH